MRTLFKALGLITILAAIAPDLSAQWPTYVVPGVPRTANGQVDLTAPAPRTAEGKPDFTGLWQTGRAGGGGGRGGGGGAAGAPAAAGAPRGGPGGPPPDAGPPRGGGAGTPPAAGAPRGGAGGPSPDAGPPRGGGAGTPPVAGARGGVATPASGPPVATFANAGAGLPEGLPFQPWAADLVKQRQADNSKDNPDAHCLPMGFLQFHNHPEPRKIVQTPGFMAIIYEANSGLRQIFMDGRSLPGKDAQPWWYGYSVGKWDGDTLVVETTGFLDGGWLDVRGSPLTEEAKVTERFRRVNYGTLEIDITVDDPKAYTKPWTVRVNQRLLPDAELIEFICEDRDATHYVGATK